MASPKAVSNAMRLVRGSYPNVEITVDMAKAYEILLIDLEDEVMLKAVAQVCRRSKFPPAVSEILEEAFHEMDEKPTALEAWGEVTDACLEGGWPEGGFSHPRIRRVVEHMGGLRQITLSEKPALTRIEFMRAYVQMTDEKREEFRALPEISDLAGRLRLEDGNARRVDHALSTGSGKD